MQTGTSDIPLTARGQEQIKSKAQSLVGEGSMCPIYTSYAGMSLMMRAL